MRDEEDGAVVVPAGLLQNFLGRDVQVVRRLWVVLEWWVGLFRL